MDVGAVEQGMVQGDAVNTAARLQSIAEPGTVLVDDVTRMASERAIVYQDAGTHVVKGKAIPVQAWRPMRIVANVGGAGERCSSCRSSDGPRNSMFCAKSSTVCSRQTPH